MTDTLLDPYDTGEIPPFDETTRIITPEVRARIVDDGGATRNLAPYMVGLPPAFRRPDATGSFPAVADLDGPPVGNPPPLPPDPDPAPKYDMADAQPINPWSRVAGADETAVVTVLESLGGRHASRHRVAKLKSGRGRHRAEPTWAWRLLRIGVGLVVLAAVIVVALAVIR